MFTELIRTGHPLAPIRDALLNAYTLSYNGTVDAYTGGSTVRLEGYQSPTHTYASLTLLDGDLVMLRVYATQVGFLCHCYKNGVWTGPGAVDKMQRLVDADLACHGALSGAIMRLCDMHRMKLVHGYEDEDVREVRTLAVYLFQEEMERIKVSRTDVPSE